MKRQHSTDIDTARLVGEAERIKDAANIFAKETESA